MRNILIIVILITLKAKSQIVIDTNVYVPNKDTLIHYLTNYYKRKSESEKTEVQVKQKYKWLRLIPDFGTTFNLIPTVSFGTNKIVYAINQKQIFKAKELSISRINEVQFNNEISNITAKRKTLIKKIESFNLQIPILELEKSLFEIYEKSYTNKELQPTNYLQKKIEYQKFINSLNLLAYEIESEKNKLLADAKVTRWKKLEE